LVALVWRGGRGASEHSVVKELIMLKSLLRSAAILLGLLGTPVGAAAQFDFSPQWRTLEEINAREGTNLVSFDVNTPQSQIRLIGGFFANSTQSWFPAIDSSRGLLYEPLFSGAMWSTTGGGSILVIDLKTMSIRRTLVIYGNEEEIVTPSSVAVDPVGNRLFVGDWQAHRMWIVDAVSGAVQSTHQCGEGCLPAFYSAATNRLLVGLGQSQPGYGPSGEMIDLGNPAAPPVPLPMLPPGEIDSAYWVLDDDARLLYTASVPSNSVHAIDIDPGSPTFNQFVWTATGAGNFTHPRGYLQPALDPIRRRLYVPDVQRGVLNVFSTAPGPSLHQLVQTIPILASLPSDPAVGVMVIPEVDPLTGLIYAVVAKDCNAELFDCFGFDATTVLTIEPTAGIVGKVTPGQTFQEARGAFLKIDPGTRRMIIGDGEVSPVHLAVLEDLRPSVLATPIVIGSSTTVSAAEASITFATVSISGITTIASRSIAGGDVQLPGQFTIDGGLLYQISTTAGISGPITLCFSAAHISDPSAFDALHVLHGENGIWVDRTTSRDFSTRTICANTTSLSPFAIVKLTTSAYLPRLLYTIDRSFKSGSTAPIKVQVLDWAGANVSSSSLSLTAVTLTRTSSTSALTVEDAGTTNPDGGFRYNESLKGYIFNLSTKGLESGTYTLTANVGVSAHYIQLPFSVR
jgi:hypothetical protein